MSETTAFKILIVDDEYPIRDLLKKLVEFLGYLPLLADNGQTAFELFQAEGPQLVISDIYMPQMNGIQLLRNIRRIQPAAPVILITGFANYKQLLLDQKNRPNDYMEKPFQLPELAQKIKAILG